MFLSFDETVASLASSIIRERCDGAGPRVLDSQESVTSFLLDLHARMPDYLRLSMRYVTIAFDAWALPFTGRPFHRLSHEKRWRQIRAWKTSSLGSFRDLIKFYESLVVFGCYSEVYGFIDEPGVRSSQPGVLPQPRQLLG